MEPTPLETFLTGGRTTREVRHVMRKRAAILLAVFVGFALIGVATVFWPPTLVFVGIGVVVFTVWWFVKH